MIAHAARSEKIMGEYKMSRLTAFFVWLAFIIMAIAAIVLLIALAMGAH
jgi:Mn2+/Fe2+ NRAMP family transporter